MPTHRQLPAPPMLMLPLVLIAGLFWLCLARPVAGQEPTAVPMPQTAQACTECHLDVANHWAESAHAHAFDDPVFQQSYSELGEPVECLACHTTDYDPVTQTYEIAGIACESCHGAVGEQHPPEPVPILADTDYCGTCHTTTINEWRMTGHSSAAIDCVDCHDPHSQQALFANPDTLCINCHREGMSSYLTDIHYEAEIGCVDCHALVIPPDPMPANGIVPTGHSFTITPATCVACHTDALHAGFALPGWDGNVHGADAAGADAAASGDVLAAEAEIETAFVAEAGGAMTPQQQIQALETALASQTVTTLFQGGIIGLVLGGTTAWYVSNNLRAREEASRGRRRDDEE